VKILVVHNRYRQRGGEDEVFLRERNTLRSAGHEVLEYTRHNGEILGNGLLEKAKLGMQTLWAWDSQKELGAILRRERPQVVHFHNTFPLISPAAYYTCQSARIPVVQSLHNARLLCPAATLSRNGKVCDECLGKVVPWPGVLHSCYHNSSLQTATVAGMVAFHRLLGSWKRKVDAYIAFTEFFREKFAAAGLPRERIFVKPHFLSSDPGMKQRPGGYALFLGRLASEKGILTLLEAWRSLNHVPLTIAGDGPLEREVERFAAGNPLVHRVRHLSHDQGIDLIKGARFLVWPSYIESFGLVAIEAFACGTPVIATQLGAMSELVEAGKTGLHFQVSNPDDLAAKVHWAWTHPREVDEMGGAARDEYRRKYTAERNYQALIGIYQKAMQNRFATGNESAAPFTLGEEARQ